MTTPSQTAEKIVNELIECESTIPEEGMNVSKMVRIITTALEEQRYAHYCEEHRFVRHTKITPKCPECACKDVRESDAKVAENALKPGTVIKLDSPDQVHEIPIAICLAIAQAIRDHK